MLIIGATGYIGGHVARRLLVAGHDVSALTRDPSKAGAIEADGMRPVFGDLNDIGPVIEAASQADAVVFAPQLLMEAEHQAVTAVLDGLAGTDKAFIFTSGTGVLGQRTLGAWSQDSFAEDDPFTPLSALTRRVETETLVRRAVDRGVRAMVIRPPRVWGHAARGHVSMAYESVQRTGSACYIGAGLNMYSNVHIDDLAGLYERALQSGAAGALYHAVAGETANRWIAERVASDMGCKSRSVTVDEAFEIWGRYQTLIVLSVSSRSRSPRSRAELGWSPTRHDMLDEIGHPAFRALARARPATDLAHDGRTATLLS